MLDAVILAGSLNSGPLRECSGEVNEAMIKIGSKPMIRYVVDALIKSKNINRVVIVGPSEIKGFFPEKSVEVVYHEGSAVKNLVKGLEFVDKSKKTLIAACDIPLLTTQAVDDLISKSKDQEIDFYYPIVPMEIIHRTFPDIKRTSVSLKEGMFTGGNLFIINPWAVERCIDKLEEFISFRKSPIQLCKLLGMTLVIKFLFNRLSISEIEQKASEILRINGRAIITNYSEIGVDVDKPSDYLIVSNYLEKPA